MERQALHMTDEEFEVLDELYFLQSFDQLTQLTERSATVLIPILESLYRKGWIKVMGAIDDELPPERVHLDGEAAHYYFLATKAGLLAHNS